MEIRKIHDIVEENGKTIKENNMEKTHNIPLGVLVEIQAGDEAEHNKIRLCVTEHRRDVDGLPLYSLGKLDRSLIHGYPEDCLMIVD